ncbi:MAG: hypothetical protein E7211_10365 [Clostridium lundense]|nr:hypothetical protein [Clostridium lundense]
MDLYEQRLFKIRKIEELYKRNIQEFISQKYKMNPNDVRKVLSLLNYSYTRKKDHENLKPGELINPIIMLDNLEFLDRYELNNFIED